MDPDLLKNMGQIAGIGGLSLGVLLIIFRNVIQKEVFSSLTKEQSFNLLKLIVILVWTIAVLGVSGWLALEFRSSSENENSAQVETLISIIDLRAKAINDQLKDYEEAQDVKKFLGEFNNLHKDHVTALRAGEFTLAHETLRRIDGLFSESDFDEIHETDNIQPAGYYQKPNPDGSRAGFRYGNYIDAETPIDKALSNYLKIFPDSFLANVTMEKDELTKQYGDYIEDISLFERP